MTDIITPIGYNEPMTYHTLHQMYGAKNIKHVGNHVLVVTPNYAIGYTIASYDGYTYRIIELKARTLKELKQRITEYWGKRS